MSLHYRLEGRQELQCTVTTLKPLYAFIRVTPLSICFRNFSLFPFPIISIFIASHSQDRTTVRYVDGRYLSITWKVETVLKQQLDFILWNGNVLTRKEL